MKGFASPELPVLSSLHVNDTRSVVIITIANSQYGAPATRMLLAAHDPVLLVQLPHHLSYPQCAQHYPPLRF